MLGLCCCKQGLLSSRGAWASHCSEFSCCRAHAQYLWCSGLVALQHVGSSQTRDRTPVPCAGTQMLHHWATRRSPYIPLFWSSNPISRNVPYRKTNTGTSLVAQWLRIESAFQCKGPAGELRLYMPQGNQAWTSQLEKAYAPQGRVHMLQQRPR